MFKIIINNQCFAKVHEPPVWIEPPKPVIGIESDPAELKCLASGSPEPQYSWVGPDGQDSTSRDGRLDR